MTGIAFLKNKHNEKEQAMNAMLEKMGHRGKGDSISLHLDHVTLGQLGTTSSGTVFQKDHLAVVLDGFIANKEDLQAKLSLEAELCDTELLIEGFKQWGHELASHLIGNFAFIIYNLQDDTVYGVRDHFGVKPFYYHESEDGLICASEIKGILAIPGFKKELNERLIAPYLIFGFNPSEETFFKGAHLLPAGTYFTYQNGDLSLHSYFRPQFKPEIQSEIGTAFNIHQTVELATKEALNDVDKENLGAFLSGGLDSSYLVALAKPHETYTAAYKEERYSEASDAKELADLLQLSNKERIIKMEEYLEATEKVMFHYDEPISDPAAISLYFGAEAAAEDVEVVLCGEGADEFFAGYSIYKDMFKLPIYSKLPGAIRRGISNIFQQMPHLKGSTFFIRRGQKIEDWYTGINWIFKEDELGGVYKREVGLTVDELTADVYARFEGESDLNKMLGFDMHFSLAKNFFMNCDKLMGAFGLKARLPLADVRVFEEASKLPIEARITKDSTKVALRQAAEHVLPKEFVRRKKLGFPVPLREWMRSDVYYATLKTKFESSVAGQFFHQDEILKLLEAHREEKEDNYKQVWAIYAFLVWYDVYFGEDDVR